MNHAKWTKSDWDSLLREHSRHNGDMYWRIAYGVLGDSEAARDVCQEALLKAWKHRQEIRDVRALGSWLTKVTISESFRLLRRRVTERRVLQRRNPSSDSGNGHAEDVERRDLVLAALEKLDEPTRTVVVLRVMEAHSGNDVSKLLEISPSEVSRRLHEGLDRLRRFVVNRHI